MVLAFLSLSTATLADGLVRKSFSAWAIYIFLNSLVFLLSSIKQEIYLLYLPPVLIPALLFVVFVRSLGQGNEPLVTGIAEKAQGPLTLVMRVYTRQVTIVWAVVFAFMVLNAILLPVYARPEIWSLFTNFINYILCGILFLGEYYFRLWRFPDQDNPGFIQHIKNIIASQIQIYGQKRQ